MRKVKAWLLPVLMFSASIFIVIYYSMSIQVPDMFETEEQTVNAGTDDYPSKTIEIVVPTGAGGDTDISARLLARQLSEELDQNIVVSNITGAGGTIGAREVLESDTDGHRILYYHDTFLINEILGLSDLTHNDFEIAGIPLMDYGDAFIANAGSQFDTMEDFIEQAKANPGEISIGTEIGGYTHLQVMALMEETGTSFNVIDVGGASDKIVSLMGNQIDMMPIVYGLTNDYIESGDFTNLALVNEGDPELFGEQPSLEDIGVDIGFEKSFFLAFPPGTPEEITNKFSGAMKNVVENNEQYRQEVSEYYQTPVYVEPDEAVAYLDDASNHYRELVQGLEESEE